MKATFEQYKAHISRFATLYRRACRIIIALNPNGKITQWTLRLLELEDTDLRRPGREEDEPSEGRVVPSWLWQVSKPSPLPGVSCVERARSIEKRISRAT